MTPREIREFRLELLDLVQEQSTEPVPDIEAVKALVEGFCGRLEAEAAGKAGGIR